MQDINLKVIPLGGVEEIGGLNMTVFEYGSDIIVVDAGLMFPEDDMFGVDYVIQDFTYLVQNRHRVRGIILTHGHEDHTGALPFLLKEINAPVYGTALTLGLVQEKLREHNITDAALNRKKPRDVFDLGAFSVEFIRITHSIVDGVALAITTPVGVVIHTGDFKIDPTPVDGELLDFNRFTHYGEKGVLLMLSDSTSKAPYFLPFLITGYNYSYGGIFNTASALGSTYNSTIPPLFAGSRYLPTHVVPAGMTTSWVALPSSPAIAFSCVCKLEQSAATVRLLPLTAGRAVSTSAGATG